MSGVRHFSRSTLPVTPWKNGGGTTQEIASWPQGAALGGFGWRVSIATIAAAGPFSVFEGIDRSIMLLEGDGVRLRSQDGAIDHRLDAAHQPFAFEGEAALDCSLLGGRSHDFNVMTRRGRCRTELPIIRERAATVQACRHGLLYALRGSWALAPGETIAQGEGVWWGDKPQGWQAQPQSSGALLLTVRFTETDEA